jgi:hypothetical protein
LDLGHVVCHICESNCLGISSQAWSEPPDRPGVQSLESFMTACVNLRSVYPKLVGFLHGTPALHTVGHKQVDTRYFVWRSPRRLDGETPTSVFTYLCPTVSGAG